MPRLSEPMREALRMADQHGALVYQWGCWTHNNPVWTSRPDLPPRCSWTARQSTIDALTKRGLLRHEGDFRVRFITRDGRVAIFRVFTPAGREAIGMKEGEDRNAEM